MSFVVFRRIESRRNNNFCTLIRYLESPQNNDQISQQSRLEYPEKKELLQVARHLFVRLFANEAIEENDIKYYQPPLKKNKGGRMEWYSFQNSGIG